MTRLINGNVSHETQKSTPSAPVELFQLDATRLGGDVYCFTNSAKEDASIIFRGVTYAPVAIEAEGFEWTAGGSLPTPKIRIGNADRVMSAAVTGYGDLLGAKLTRIRTFARFLDNGIQPDPDAILPIDVYKVERKSSHSKLMIEWELSAAMDQEGRMLPGRQVLRDACAFRYRRWDKTAQAWDYTGVTCPYTDASEYDDLDLATTPDKGRCSKKLSGCKARFGENAALPFGGFPGVSRVRLT